MGDYLSISEWGDVMRLARRSSSLAIADARQRGLIKDPLDAAIMLFTDDPDADAMLSDNDDLKHICLVSEIIGISTVTSGSFPPSSFEAVRPEASYPRIAAMFFHAVGGKCPRCRLRGGLGERGICARCETIIDGVALAGAARP